MIHNAEKSAYDASKKSAFAVLLHESKKPRLVTFIPDLDHILGGGIPTSCITELYGVPGVGKTELCMQLCANCHMPVDLGGLNCSALFIDTEGGFCWSRYREIVKATSDHVRTFSEGEEMVQQMLDSTFVKCPDDEAALLADVLSLPVFLSEHPNVHVVIIDSIAFPFQKGVDDRGFGSSRIVALIMQSLVMTASEHNCTIVITNHITIKPPSSSSLMARARSVPSMGEGFGHLSSIRLHLLWAERVRCVAIDKMIPGLMAQTVESSEEDASTVPTALIPFAIVPAGIRSSEIIMSD